MALVGRLVVVVSATLAAVATAQGSGLASEALVKDATSWPYDAYFGIRDAAIGKQGPFQVSQARPAAAGGASKVDIWRNENRLSWQDARAACERLDATLALFESDAVGGAEGKLLGALLGNEKVWFGQNETVSGKVKDASGSEITFGAEKRCAELQKTKIQFYATAQDCSALKKSICMRKGSLTQGRRVNTQPMRYFLVKLDPNSAKEGTDECFKHAAHAAVIRDAEELAEARRVARQNFHKKIFVGARSTNSQPWAWDGTAAFALNGQAELVEISSALWDNVNDAAVSPGCSVLALNSDSHSRKFTPVPCDMSGLSVDARPDAVLCERTQPALHDERTGATIWITEEEATWEDAKLSCKRQGGELASVLSAEEQRMVEALVRRDAWIGVQRTESDPKPTTWSDGTSFTFANWAPGAENNQSGDARTCVWEEVYRNYGAFSREPEGARSSIQEDLRVITPTSVRSPTSKTEAAFDAQWNRIDLSHRAARLRLNGHPYLFYKRRTTFADSPFPAFQQFVLDWQATRNQLGTDFDLFSTEAEMHSSENPWAFCALNAGRRKVGLAFDCGPQKNVPWGFVTEDRNEQYYPQSSAIDFCTSLRKAACARVSTDPRQAGKWVYGRCDERRPSVCRSVETSEAKLGHSFTAENFDYSMRLEPNTPIDEAAAKCASDGGRLAMPKRSAEFQVIRDSVSEGQGLLLGGRRATTRFLPNNQGPFSEWDDGTPLNFATVSWIDAGQPNLYGAFPARQDALAVVSWVSGTTLRAGLADVPDADSNGFICEFPRRGPRETTKHTTKPAAVDSYYLWGASQVALDKDGSRILGNSELGLIARLPQDSSAGIQILVGGSGSSSSTCNRDVSTCQAWGIEPHRWYCFTATACDSSDPSKLPTTFTLNTPDTVYGPTAIAIHPATNELYFAIHKVAGTALTLSADITLGAEYEGSVVLRVDESTDQKKLVVVLGGGNELPADFPIDLSATNTRSKFINALAFGSSGEKLYVSDRDARAIYALNTQSGTIKHVAGKHDPAASPLRYVNAETPDYTGGKPDEAEIGVPQYLFFSKEREAESLFVATLLVNDEFNDNQEYHVLRIDFSGPQGASVSYPLAGVAPGGLSGTVARGEQSESLYRRTAGVAFEHPITGLAGDSHGRIYVAQRETSAIFYADVALGASTTLFPLKAISNTGRDTIHQLRADDIALHEATGKLVLLSAFEPSITPLREVFLPVRLGGPTLIWDESLGGCFESLDATAMAVHLRSAALLASNPANHTDDLFEMVTQAAICSTAFVTKRRNPEINGGPTPDETLLLRDAVKSADAIASQGDLPGAVRGEAAHIAQTWRWFMMAERSPYKTRYPPPPPMPRLGPNAIGTQDLADYEEIIGIENGRESSGLLVTCLDALKSFVVCECGSVYDRRSSGACRPIEPSKVTNTYSAWAYCALGEEILAKADGVVLPLLFRIAECSALDGWKTGATVASLGLMDLVGGVARLAASAKSASVGTARELTALANDLAERRLQFAEDQAMMVEFRAVSVARPDSVCLARGCKWSTDRLLAALDREGIKNAIAEGTAEVSLALRVSTNAIRDDIAVASNITTASIAALGNLVTSLASGISQQIAQNFAIVAETKKKDAVGELAVFDEELEQTRAKFLNSINSIKGDYESGTKHMESMSKTATSLASTTKDFYECKKDQELAELARARAMGIFNVVVGAFELVADVGLFLFSGGASAAGKVAARAASRAVNFVGDANKVANKVASKFRKGFDSPDPSGNRNKGIKPGQTDFVERGLAEVAELLPRGTVSNNLNAIGEAFGKLGDADFSSGDNVVDFLAGTLETLDDAGIPGAGGAAKILSGVMALANYEDQRKEVNSKYKSNLAKSAAAFEQIAAMAREIATFFTELSLEFYQITLGNIPITSSIESRSTAFWVAIQRELVFFIENTDMFIDFQNAAGRRRLGIALDEPVSVEPSLLEAAVTSPDVDTRALLGAAARDGGDSVAQRLRSRAAGPRALVSANLAAAAPATLRRVLDDKKGCPDEDLQGFASSGLSGFEQYIVDLKQAVLFGQSMHQSLVQFVVTARKIALLRLKIEKEKISVAGWDEAASTFSNSNITTTEPLNKFRANLAVFQRSAPEVQLRRDPRVFNKVVELQKGLFAQVCNAAWYSDLALMPSCDFRTNSIFQVDGVEDQLDALGGVIKRLGDDFSDKEATAQGRRKDWFRIELSSAKQIRAQLQGLDINETTTYEFDLFELDEGFEGCGYNFEVHAQTFLLETVVEERPRHARAFQDSWVEVGFQPRGPFVKLDKAGNRHLFDVQQTKQLAARKVRVFEEDAEDAATCGKPNFEVDSFVLREGSARLCYEKAIDQVDPLPVLGRYSMPLGKTFAALINQGDDSLKLVMYAQLTAFGLSDACQANRFSTRGAAELEGGTANAGSNLGLIIGLSAAGVVLLGGSAFAYRKFGSQIRSRIFGSGVGASGAVATAVMEPIKTGARDEVPL